MEVTESQKEIAKYFNELLNGDTFGCATWVPIWMEEDIRRMGQLIALNIRPIIWDKNAGKVFLAVF